MILINYKESSLSNMRHILIMNSVAQSYVQTGWNVPVVIIHEVSTVLWAVLTFGTLMAVLSLQRELITLWKTGVLSLNRQPLLVDKSSGNTRESKV